MWWILAIIKVVKAGKTKASLKSALNYIANEEKITTITGKKLEEPKAKKALPKKSEK